MFSIVDRLILYICCAVLIGVSIQLYHGTPMDRLAREYRKKDYCNNNREYCNSSKSQKRGSYHKYKKPRLKYSKEVQEMQKEYNSNE